LDFEPFFVFCLVVDIRVAVEKHYPISLRQLLYDSCTARAAARV